MSADFLSGGAGLGGKGGGQCLRRKMERVPKYVPDSTELG